MSETKEADIVQLTSFPMFASSDGDKQNNKRAYIDFIELIADFEVF